MFDTKDKKISKTQEYKRKKKEAVLSGYRSAMGLDDATIGESHKIKRHKALSKEGLALVTNLISLGLNVAEVAPIVGISKQCFYNFCERYADFREAVRFGQENIVRSTRRRLFEIMEDDTVPPAVTLNAIQYVETHVFKGLHAQFEEEENVNNAQITINVSAGTLSE